MYASRVFHVSILTLALVTAGHAGVANAASVPSDRLLVTDTTGTAIFDNSLPEGTAAGETTLTFAGGPLPVTPPPIPIASAITIPGVAILVLTEPAGTVPDPLEPPLILTGPNGDIFVSDLVVSTLPVAGIPQFVSLLSDGDPELQSILPVLATMPGVQYLAETGQLQDITALVTGPQTPGGPIRVQVQSDTPEPAGLVLIGAGLALVSLVRRRSVH
jgi:hypothetical protein